MIRFKFIGGLGNQLFQYAFYLKLKQRFPDTDFFLDFDSYKYEKFHTGFRIEQAFYFPMPSGIHNSYSLVEKLFYKIKTNLILYWYKYINSNAFFEDKNFDFNHLSHQLNSGKNCFIRGTWASEKYFEEIKEDIIHNLAIRQDLIRSKVKELALEAHQKESIAIHIRRGDYLKSHFTPLASTNYYSKALSFLIHQIENTNNTKLYIISDDINWCKQNLNYLHSYNICFIDENTDYEDLYFMSQCKYLIIANSTFSWWGAYLSSAQIVVAPANIYKDKLLSNTELKFKYPSNWIIM